MASRGLRQMIKIISMVVQSQRLKILQRATSISLSVDDRADYRLLRYRASFSSFDVWKALVQGTGISTSCELSQDTKLEQWCDIDPLILEGVLGVFRTGGNVNANTIASHDEDKSKKMADSIVEMIRQSCKDIEGQVDEDAFATICRHVQHYASDQGSSAHKCGQLLSLRPELCSIAWVSCDMAHQVRIASKDPLHAEESFSTQWERIFSAKHALVPDLQNSEVWKSRLVAAQREVLRSCGSQGGGLDHCLRSLSFAKQRFDSTSTPMLKFCLMLRAIALVCAMQAGDEPWRECRKQLGQCVLELSVSWTNAFP